MYRKEAVATLAGALSELALDPPIEIGTPDCFGLALDLYDPLSGQVITVARPARSDIGQGEVLLTPQAAVQAITSARMTRVHQVRAQGFASIEAAEEDAKRRAEAADLAYRQAQERAKLDAEHAEATAKLAAESQPKPPEPADGTEAEDAAARDTAAIAAQAKARQAPAPRARV
jgi:hypothetical protein